jgi:hypothetical protein
MSIQLRTRIKAGIAVNFTNIGDIPHTATAFEEEKSAIGIRAFTAKVNQRR